MRVPGRRRLSISRACRILLVALLQRYLIRGLLAGALRE
jgi:hypothetical protein